MKIALLLVLFSSSVIGVFADEVKSVSVMEGDSVTLHTGVTIIQGSDSIEWRFNGIRMAKIKSDSTRTDESFRDSMQLNSQTGDLRITNIRPTDSGLYKLIKKGRDLSEMTFSVTVVISSGVKSASVTEGDSVTLNSGLTEIQRDDKIRWSFKNNSIADQRFSTDDDVLDERFRGRLKLDDQTGSLTITNTRNTDDGEYEVEISTNRFTIHKRISVTVNEIVTLVLVMEGDSVTLHTGASILRNYAVLWFGENNTLITPLTGSVDPRWKNTVQNDRTGDLTIRNIQRNQSGDYKVIFIDKQTFFTSIHRKFHINIIDSDLFSDYADSDLFSVYPDSDLYYLDSDLSSVDPDSGLSSGAVVGIVIAVLEAVAIAAAVGGLIYYRHKSSKLERSREENGQKQTSNKDEETELTKPAEAV